MLAALPPAELRVVLVGDSTMAPRTGYGDAFCGLFQWPVRCVNLGRGGRSTKSYRADGSWDRALATLRDPDGVRTTYVLLQLGHNDQPGKAERATDLATEYPANLKRYVEEIRREGARPVLVTPLTRRTFDGGRLRNDLEPWAEAVRRVAAEEQVPLLDLNADSVAAVAPLGQAGADAFAQEPAPHKSFDRTHLGPKGAAFFARVLAKRTAEVLPEVARTFAVGAIEPPGPVERPQLTPAQAKAHGYREVLAGWDPLAGPIAPIRADYIVDPAAPGDDGRVFRGVQGAIDQAVMRGGAERVHVLLKPGTHAGPVFIAATAPPLTLYGESSDARAVRLRANVVGAPGSVAVLSVRARGFRALNLTIENAHNKDRGDVADQTQGVALMLDDADEAWLENVRLVGFQDTFFLASSRPQRPSRAFVHRSYVEGDMDFIFGEATGYFLDTEVRTLGDRAISYTLAPSTHADSPYGFVFERCRFTHDGTPNARAGVFKLGRQWARSPQAVGKAAILHSTIGAHIDPVRPWADWSIGTPRHRPVQYRYLGEYDNRSVEGGPP